jgi:hypothetical protein
MHVLKKTFVAQLRSCSPNRRFCAGAIITIALNAICASIVKADPYVDCRHIHTFIANMKDSVIDRKSVKILKSADSVIFYLMPIEDHGDHITLKLRTPINKEWLEIDVRRVISVGADYFPFDPLEKNECGGERFIFSGRNKHATTVVTKICRIGNNFDKYYVKVDKIETETDNYKGYCKSQ